MEWTEQFDPALDFPPSGDVSIRYAICSTPRSGSHFLGQYLYATGNMGCPLEYFNRRNIVRWEERAGTAETGADVVRFIAGIRTSPNGCFGIKAHYPHLRTLTRHIPIAEFVSAFAHIHIVRRDLLAQAISFARAEQTDDWISRGPASGRSAVYDSDLIRHCLVEIGRQNASWDYLFHAFGIRPLVVEYESLAADPPACVRRVAGFIGVDLPADTPIPGPRTSRQRDEESESWRDRFIDEMRRDAISWADLDVLQHVPGVTGETTVPRWKRWVEAALRV
jgi:LPS sulfotransferase NodH